MARLHPSSFLSSVPRRSRWCRIVGLCVLCGAAVSCAASRTRTTSQTNPTIQPIPFTIEDIYGQRPVVEIAINGHAYRAMIHANAGFYLQISHAQADAVGVKDLKHLDSYGIEAAGKVSALGRDSGVVDRLAVGSVVDHNAPVSVFETPGPERDSVCMLGLGWISKHALVLDFARNEVTAVLQSDPEAAAARRSQLLAAGYAAFPMSRQDGENGRYVITVTIGQTPATMIVSTVGELTLDTDFAERAGVTRGSVLGEFGGPSGATGTLYQTRDPVVLGIGNWRAGPMQATIEDTYAYMKEPRPSEASGGMIGADFLIANGAVIDFGSKTLYLRSLAEEITP